MTWGPIDIFLYTLSIEAHHLRLSVKYGSSAACGETLVATTVDVTTWALNSFVHQCNVSWILCLQQERFAHRLSGTNKLECN